MTFDNVFTIHFSLRQFSKIKKCTFIEQHAHLHNFGLSFST